jgi:protein TonB
MNIKQLLTAIAVLFLFICCRRSDLNKQTLPVAMKADTVAEKSNEDVFVCRMPIIAEFPGGMEAWRQFLQNNLVYPKTAADKNIQGTVMVQFIVSHDGTVSNIEAISGPAELRESAIEVVKKSPNWIPALDNGRNVKDYKKQPIVFQLKEE